MNPAKKVENIAFIGLGIMGKPMAKNLLKAGYALKVYDIVPEAVREMAEAGAVTAQSPMDAAEFGRVIITMLPNSPEVESVVLGKNGVLDGANPGSILVDMSSISPMAAIKIAAEARAREIVMLDAPVSGGQPKAIDGTLAIMVGGPQEAFDRVRDILAKMGSSVTRVGDIGSGNITKLANQIIVALNIAAMSEAMVLATKAGVDPEKVFQAIRGGLAGSTVLNAKMPLVLAGNFAPGFRIELHIKDLLNAMEAAHKYGVPLPLTSLVLESMEAMRVDGKAKEDHGGLIQYYEKMAHVAVRRRAEC